MLFDLKNNMYIYVIVVSLYPTDSKSRHNDNTRINIS
jgi:hypothetical protein